MEGSELIFDSSNEIEIAVSGHTIIIVFESGIV